MSTRKKTSQASEGAIRYGRSPYAAWRGEPLSPLGRSMLQLVAAAWRAGEPLSHDQLLFELVEKGHALEDVRETHSEFYGQKLLLPDRTALIPGIGALIELGDAEAEADLETLARLVGEVRRRYRPDLKELSLDVLANPVGASLAEVRRLAPLVPSFQEERGIVLSINVLGWDSFPHFLEMVLPGLRPPGPRRSEKKSFPPEPPPLEVQLGFQPSSVQWTNLGPYEVATLELAPLTILVGGNGVGKTSALQALALCSSLVTHGLSLFANWRGVRLPFAPPSMVRDQCKEFSIQVTGQLDRLGVTWKPARWLLSVATAPRTCVQRETVGAVGEDPEAALELGVGDWLVPGNSRGPLQLRPDQLALARMTDPMVHPAAIAVAQSLRNWSVDTPLATGRDDHGQPILFERPKFSRGELPRAALNEILSGLVGRFRLSGDVPLGFMITDPRGRTTPVDHAPSGVLRIIEIFAELLRPTPPSLLAIDELETHLHADVIGRLIDVLRSFTDRTRIVVTTHSASVLRAARVDEVRVIRSGARASVIERADRDPVLRELVQTCSMDELLGLGAFAGPP